MAGSKLYAGFQRMAEGKTALLITHRLASTMITDRVSVASLAGRIIVFAGGRVVENGTHEALLEKGGGYARPYGEQAKWYQR